MIVLTKIDDKLSNRGGSTNPFTEDTPPPKQVKLAQNVRYNF